MTDIKFTNRLVELWDDEDNPLITTKLGQCLLPSEGQLETIAEYINLPSCRVDYFVFNEIPYISFSSLKDWQSKLYVLNLFTLKPTKTSKKQETIPRTLRDKLMANVKYVRPSLVPDKEALKELLFKDGDNCWIISVCSN